jgi:hypothetical protein
MAENLADIRPPDPDGKIIHAMSEPIHRTGGCSSCAVRCARGRGREERLHRRDVIEGRPGSSTTSATPWTR